MASADNPVAPDHFNEDEDLLDDEEFSDHDDDDSASSAALALDRPPPSASDAQVTIAVPGIPDPHLTHHHHHHNHHHQPQQQQQTQEIVIARRPVPPDESRKLFQRLWTDEDEIELLQGFLDYTSQHRGPHGSAQHHHDTTAFYDQIRSKFQLDFNKNQLVEKLRRLKKKYRNIINKFGSGKDYTFKSPHEQATFEISAKIWGNLPPFNVNVSSSAFPAVAAPAPITVPIEDDDDDLNNPNFADCQSPKLNGIDINSKTPRPKKRNRAGMVKMEERQHHASIGNINNCTQPPPAVAAQGITGSLSSVIEDTVRSCLSPIFKELLSNSMNSNHSPHGLFCGQPGYELTRSPLPLGFAAAIGGGGDKVANNRWRKQQILELEVFSKRLELVQDQIKEQLEELRSMGN
ncbi:DNA-binding storekeeper protein-relatedtranscriptional regulator [Striga asiatica]|uniref:DNA-binding storekeeper protein-relatedtranscriptional regulator n=1 Tax=Striga asiatica TaxID=4170 RepID=A0A5A7Q0M0_STRAF|nr:DNA-binding storekeeper protein-relatedtranscriptional regulator [Striga asiatica]